LPFQATTATHYHKTYLAYPGFIHYFCLMKKILFFCAFQILTCFVICKGQTPVDTAHHWKKTGIVGINFNQASLTNWQGGGQNTIAAAGFVHLTANYEKGRNAWLNGLDAAYGVVKLGGKNSLYQKSDDELKIFSGYRRFLQKKLYFAVSADFKTNFAAGYKYGKDSVGNLVRQERLSGFMSPAYLIIGAGLEYKPSDVFFVFVSPLASRITFILDDSMAAAGMYGVPAGQHIRVEIGEEIKMGLKLPIMKNVLLESSLELFGNYRHLQQQVVDWRNDLSFKVNNIFTALVSTRLIYDQDIAVKRDNGTTGPAVQFKEVIALGIQYKLY
jgi:hypothetical protein